MYGPAQASHVEFHSISILSDPFYITCSDLPRLQRIPHVHIRSNEPLILTCMRTHYYRRSWLPECSNNELVAHMVSSPCSLSCLSSKSLLSDSSVFSSPSSLCKPSSLSLSTWHPVLLRGTCSPPPNTSSSSCEVGLALALACCLKKVPSVTARHTSSPYFSTKVLNSLSAKFMYNTIRG